LEKLLDGDEQEHYRNFDGLCHSAESCRLCALIHYSAMEQGEFVADGRQSIRLAGVKSKSGGLRNIQVKFPTTENSQAGGLPNGSRAVRYVDLELVADCGMFDSISLQAVHTELSPRESDEQEFPHIRSAS